MQESRIRSGVMRLYLEVRFDIPFSFVEALPVKDIVRRLLVKYPPCKLVKSGKDRYAEEIHAIMVDIDMGKGIEGLPYKPQYETLIYETPEEINNLLYEP